MKEHLYYTTKDIEYHCGGTIPPVTIPKGTEVSLAVTLPEEDGVRFWANPWTGMSEQAEGWAKGYGFLIKPYEVEKFGIVSFNYGELILPVQALEQCMHQGVCDHDVEFWLPRIDWDSQPMDATNIRAELHEHGAWDDEELADDIANRRRILWIASGNYQDEED